MENPENASKEKLSPEELKKRKKITIVVWSFFALSIIFAVAISGNGSERPNRDTVYNSEWDGSVKQVERYIKSILLDPASYKGISWTEVKKNATGFIVQHSYQAKNKLGLLSVTTQAFELDRYGKVKNVITLD